MEPPNLLNIERKQLKEKVIQVNGNLKYFKTANAT